MKMSTSLLNSIARKIGLHKSQIVAWDLTILHEVHKSRPDALLTVTVKSQRLQEVFVVTKKIPYGDLLSWFEWEA